MADSTLTAPEANPEVPTGHGSGGRTDGRGPRPLQRPRALPNGRAVAGGLLVFAAAIGIFSAYTRFNAGPRHSYIVVRHDVAIGEVLRPSDLGLQAMDLPTSLQRVAFDDATPLLGATVVAPLGRGELVQASDVVRRTTPASQEVTFAVDRTHASADIREGERIDVLVTVGNATTTTTVVVHGALVVGFETGREALNDAGYLVTVALDRQADVLALAQASQLGKITVVRIPGSTAQTPLPPVTPAAGASAASTTPSTTTTAAP